MGLFGNKKDSVKSNDHGASKTDVKEEKKEKGEKNDKVLQQNSDGSLAYEFIVKPWITEKTHELMADDKYVFKIRQKTTKFQVKKAVENLYEVEVKKVNIVNIHQKKRRFGRIMGKKSAIKKAIVTLKEGNKIEIFE